MPDGTNDTDVLALQLVQQGALLTRAIFARTNIGIARSEAACLARLEDGRKRISDIASMEGLAQPTVTLIIKRLEESGLVERHGDPKDGRVVLVAITPAGTEVRARVRQQYQDFLGARLTQLSASDLDALERWSEVMPRLLDLITAEN